MTADTSVHGDAELDALNDELSGLNLEGHWRLQGVTEAEPRPWAPPNMWKWADIRRILLKAGELRAIEGGASRRTVRLCTPGISEKWASRTVHASYQLVKPGEIAEAHRHSMGALRFVVEGGGGHTTVDGEKFVMEEGDLIITPGGTWHDHANESPNSMIWLDGHDAPMTLRLNAMFYEGYTAPRQEVVHRTGYSKGRAGALKPLGLRSHSAGSPYIYKAAEAVSVLRDMSESEWDIHDGYALDYIDPLTRSYTLAAIACRLQRLPSGSNTIGQRHTTTRIIQVMSGQGKTFAGGKVFEWQKGDALVIPAWTWFHHQGAGNDDSFLFSMTDEPVFAALALLRSEYRDRNDN